MAAKTGYESAVPFITAVQEHSPGENEQQNVQQYKIEGGDSGDVYYDNSGQGNYQKIDIRRDGDGHNDDNKNNNNNNNCANDHNTGVPPLGPSWKTAHRRYRVDWRYPTLAVFLFAAGVAFAVGHDLYYHSLDGTLADPGADNGNGTAAILFDESSENISSNDKQTWAIRIGTGLAFLNKTALVAVIGLVGAQQVWATLRRKAITINGIDRMFDVMSNPVALLNWDLLANAKILVMLAILSCLVQMAVPTVNFTDYTQFVTTIADFVNDASYDIDTIFSNVCSSYSSLPLPAPFINSSYEQKFYGPSYKCISFNEAIAANYSPTWLIDQSEFNVTYKTFADVFYDVLGVPPVHDPQNSTSVIYSASAPGFLYNMILISAGGTNPLWDGGNDTVINTTTTTSSSGTEATHVTLAGPPGNNMVCQMYNTSFHVSMRFENGVQSIVPLDIEYLEPQNWDTFAGMNSLRPCPADPGPSTDGNCTQATPTYYATHLLLQEMMQSVGEEPGLQILQSALIHCPDIYNSTKFKESGLVDNTTVLNPARCRNGTLAAAIEDLSRNFTYSTLTFDGWSNYTKTVDVTAVTSRLFFVYARRTLWTAYASVLAVTLATMVVGAYAVWRNGVVSSTSFSTTLMTTRNPQLDGLVRGASGYAAASAQGPPHPPACSSAHADAVCWRSLGAQPSDKQIGQLRLRFGYIQTDDQVSQAGFGLDGTVQPLRSGY